MLRLRKSTECFKKIINGYAAMLSPFCFLDFVGENWGFVSLCKVYPSALLSSSARSIVSFSRPDRMRDRLPWLIPDSFDRSCHFNPAADSATERLSMKVFMAVHCA